MTKTKLLSVEEAKEYESCGKIGSIILEQAQEIESLQKKNGKLLEFKENVTKICYEYEDSDDVHEMLIGEIEK